MHQGLSDGFFHFARHTGRNNTCWNIADYHTACGYHTALPYGNTATDGAIGAYPHLIFYGDWGRYAQSLGTVFGLDGMAGATDAHARCYEHLIADVHRAGVQNHRVVVQQGETVKMDIESVIALERGLDYGVIGTAAQQFTEYFTAFLHFIRS